MVFPALCHGAWALREVDPLSLNINDPGSAQQVFRDMTMSCWGSVCSLFVLILPCAPIQNRPSSEHLISILPCGGRFRWVELYSFRIENCLHGSEFAGHGGSSLLGSQRIPFYFQKLCAHNEEPSNETHPIYGRRGPTAQ